MESRKINMRYASEYYRRYRRRPSPKELFTFAKCEPTEKEEHIISILENIQEKARQRDELVRKLELKLYYDFLVKRNIV